MIRVVEEAELDPALRAAAAELLVAEWGEEWREDAYAGPHPPLFRVVETADGVLAGQLSAFSIPTDPARRLIGIGDLVVAASRRGAGVATRLAQAVVAECARRATEIVLVDTFDAARIFGRLGFEPAPPFAFFYVADGACHRHRHWLVSAPVDLAERVELLEHGDF